MANAFGFPFRREVGFQHRVTSGNALPILEDMLFEAATNAAASGIVGISGTATARLFIRATASGAASVTGQAQGDVSTGPEAAASGVADVVGYAAAVSRVWWADIADATGAWAGESLAGGDWTQETAPGAWSGIAPAAGDWINAGAAAGAWT